MTSGPPAPASSYIHGFSLTEQERLSRLNDLLNGSALRELRPVAGERVVDFGAGLGQLTRAIARATGTRAVAIERSAAQIAKGLALAESEGEADLIEYREGSGEDPPLDATEWGAFDLAHARFLLEHLREPLVVVRQMVRAVRPGGRVVLQDDDHDTLRLWPEPPGFRALWWAYVRAQESEGNDPYVGRRLVALLAAAGAVPRRSSMIFFGGCAGTPELATMVGNVIGIFDGVRNRMVRESMLTEADYERGIADFRDWGTRPDAGFWYAVPWVEGVRAE